MVYVLGIQNREVSMSTDKGGRPAIGPKIPVNYPESLLQRIDSAADDAGITRAEWLRRTASSALPETYEGFVQPAQMAAYLRGSADGEDLREGGQDRNVGVSADTILRILRAVDDDALRCGPVETKAVRRETPGSRRSLTLTTRSLQVGNEAVVIYQAAYTTISLPGVGQEGVYHHERYIYSDREAAEDWYEYMIESNMN
jgi:hypothetical protein